MEKPHSFLEEDLEVDNRISAVNKRFLSKLKVQMKIEKKRKNVEQKGIYRK
jgi:hypothetical protein